MVEHILMILILVHKTIVRDCLKLKTSWPNSFKRSWQPNLMRLSYFSSCFKQPDENSSILFQKPIWPDGDRPPEPVLNTHDKLYSTVKPLVPEASKSFINLNQSYILIKNLIYLFLIKLVLIALHSFNITS